MPFGEPGADWLLLNPDVQLRHTGYDLARAADRVRSTTYPQAEEFAARNIPVCDESVLLEQAVTDEFGHAIHEDCYLSKLFGGDVSDPGVWTQVHDEGVQALENIANIRVPVIAAIEGRAHVLSDYALLASVIVAGDGATFQDVAHFSAGVTPGDGIFTTWSYRAGAGRAEAFLLNPQPLTARTAYEWGVVAEVVPNGKALLLHPLKV